jgi:hypothetical protein
MSQKKMTALKPRDSNNRKLKMEKSGVTMNKGQEMKNRELNQSIVRKRTLKHLLRMLVCFLKKTISLMLVVVNVMIL